MKISSLHEWLKELRQDKGLDIRQLAQESNFASAQVSRIETAKAGLTLGALVHLSYGLDLSLDDVLQKLELPLMHHRFGATREPEANQPVPSLTDARAIWLLFRDEPQKAKQLLTSGFTEIRQAMSESGDKPDLQKLAELVWEATQGLGDKFSPLPYPTGLSRDHLLEIYVVGGVVTMKDISAFVKSSRQNQGFTLRALAKVMGISNAAISRFENGQVERVFFSQILDFDREMSLNGELVALAWDAAEYQSGLAINKMLNERDGEKSVPTDWDPVEKAFADTFITICRWHHVYGQEQNWWQEVKRELRFYQF